MNTAKHTKKVRIEHTVEMEGLITARDLGDFIHQVDNVFEQETGRTVKHDDDYYVEPTDTGIRARFTTKENQR